MCPVCAVAVGFGLGLSRWLKIDDTVTGLWVGALIVSLSFVLALWTKKYLVVSKGILTLFYFILLLLTTFIPLQYLNIIGHPLNTIFGIDKLVFGTMVGIIVFLFSLFVHGYLKYHNNNRSYFPFQKVIIPVNILTIASIMMYLFVK